MTALTLCRAFAAVALAIVVGTPAAATELSLQDKAFHGRLSVRDFGAKGDGVTDDTAAIQAGIDFLTKRGANMTCRELGAKD